MTSKLTSIGKDSIKRVGDGNIVNEANIASKIYIGASESGMEFITPRTRLAFIKLR